MPRTTFLSKFHVSKPEAFRAFDAVCRELRALGLMPQGGELEGVCCEWHPAEIGSFAVTGYRPSDFATEGYYWNRTIHLPAWGFWFGSADGIRNVVRHEFGHALADIRPKLFKGAVFHRAFGAPYGRRGVARFRADWEESCVSEYAASCTGEDWAETFMLFLRNKGRMPARFRGLSDVEAKWGATHKILSKMGWNRG